MKEIIINIKVISVFIFLGSFVLTYLITPKIIDFVNYKKLMDNPNNRSSHQVRTPTLGGIGFFITLLISLFFIRHWDIETIALSTIPGLTILFFIGLKDYLAAIAPITKLIAQIIAVCFVLSIETMILKSLNGFFDIYEVSNLFAYPMSVFFMLSIINAFNLIDGIDGLASIIGIIVCLCFGIVYYYLGLYFFSLLCVVVIGTLIAFLRFNLSNDKKIFMGDTGSLIIGFLISIMAIRFLAISPQKLSELPFQLENLPLIVLAILIVPLFDTTRVFIIRILKNKNPFSPDRKHIHHLLIDFGFSHRKASLIIGAFNVLFLFLFILLARVVSYGYIIGAFIIAILIILYILYQIDFSFSNLKRRILFKRKVDKIKQTIKSKKPKS